MCRMYTFMLSMLILGVATRALTEEEGDSSAELENKIRSLLSEEMVDSRFANAYDQARSRRRTCMGKPCNSRGGSDGRGKKQ